MKSLPKTIAVAGVLAFAALCHELGASNWVIGAVGASAAAVAVSWNSVENKVTAWMPDKDFPNWMLAEMAASGRSG